MAYWDRFMVCENESDPEMESALLSQTSTLQIEDEDGSQDPEENNSETDEMFWAKVANFIRQMMFVSGETAEPSIETTTLIEDIVRQQVVEIVWPFAHLTVDMY